MCIQLFIKSVYMCPLLFAALYFLQACIPHAYMRSRIAFSLCSDAFFSCSYVRFKRIALEKFKHVGMGLATKGSIAEEFFFYLAAGVVPQAKPSLSGARSEFDFDFLETGPRGSSLACRNEIILLQFAIIIAMEC